MQESQPIGCMLPRLDLPRDPVVFCFRNDVPLHQVVGVAVWPMFDDTVCRLIIDTIKRAQIRSGCLVDIDGALLPNTLHDALGYGLCITHSRRSRMSRLFPNRIRTAVVSSAPNQTNTNQRNESKNPHSSWMRRIAAWWRVSELARSRR